VALGALLAAAALAAGAAGGRPALTAAVLLVQLLLGLCWLTVLQSSLATAALVGLAALACDSLLLRDDADAGSVAGVIGLALLAAILLQLANSQRRDVTRGLAAAMSGVVLVAAVSLLLPLLQFESGKAVALTALVGVAVAMVGARLVPGPPELVRPAAFVVAVLVAGRYGATTEDLAAGSALATAGVAAAFALVTDLGVVRLGSEVGVRQRPALRTVAALLPVVAAVPGVYVVGWLIGG
jgi:hypothetical protein